MTYYDELKIKVFISYKNEKNSEEIKFEIFDELTARDFNPFLDKKRLKGGDPWPVELEENVISSDVLLLLLTEGAGGSDWVKTEVSLAKYMKIVIIPVLLMTNEKEAHNVLGALEIPHIQWTEFDWRKPDFDKLSTEIRNKAKDTEDNQQKWIEKIQQRRKKRIANDRLNHPAKTTPIVASYQYILPNGQAHQTKICLAAGDITQMQKIDILVNSENSYMQMARFYEANTVSGKIRKSGVKSDGDHCYSDKIQEELTLQVRTKEKSARVPVELTKVYATTAGDENGILRQENEIRYIFHVAIVSPSSTGGLNSLNVDYVSTSVVKCLNTVLEVNQHYGNIFLLKKTRYAEIEPKRQNAAADYQAIRHIVFPALGAGTGNLAFGVSVSAILKGIEKFLATNTGTLERIHIAAYTNREVIELTKILDDRYQKI